MRRQVRLVCVSMCVCVCVCVWQWSAGYCVGDWAGPPGGSNESVCVCVCGASLY